uniref:DUF4145 domain-containing protein n=2 Tax=Pannonibacter phragmitetus TaxID=121719 RepID=UPI000B96A7F9|nr:DUF4145 domain-containing protein [Pannonibacter phragmitetus]
MRKMTREAKDPVKEHCPTCDGERACDVHGHIYVPWTWEDRYGHSMCGGVDHSLLQCRGCETVFYLHDSWNEIDVEQWYDENGEEQGAANRTKVTYPRPDSKNRPIWLDSIGNVDEQLQNILDQMYTTYENKAYILTAIGLRTALDRGTEVLGIDPAKTFQEKLAELQSGGWIGSTEHDILSVIADAGNAAAHRGWMPEPKEISELLYAIEVFLQRAFLVEKKALKVRERIPEKPKRKDKKR